MRTKHTFRLPPEGAYRGPRSLPARYPPTGAWPAEMPSDMVAAFFGHETTGKLLKAIERGEAPRPTATRLREKRRHEPVWARDACLKFIADRHGLVCEAPAVSERLEDDI
jgi:hypothetical protein